MPEEVEDIFAESAPEPVAPAEKPTPQKPAAPAAPQPMVEEKIEEAEEIDIPEDRPKRGPFPWKTILIIAAVIIILGGLVGGGYFVYQNFFKDGANGESSGKEGIDITEVGANGGQATGTVVIIDTDFDGLSDEEEEEYNTSIKMADTDEDGLTDREEIRVYLTDPLKKDTDGDKYSDGEEVANGFNPLGDGPLLDLEEEINRINNTNE